MGVAPDEAVTASAVANPESLEPFVARATPLLDAGSGRRLPDSGGGRHR